MEAAADLIRRGTAVVVAQVGLQRPSKKRYFKKTSSIPL
jgi:hypothetical protein